MDEKHKKPAREELWVAPRYSLKGQSGDHAWDKHVSGLPSHSRYLELADIAMGTKKPEPFKKRKTSPHQIGKTEPYSNS